MREEKNREKTKNSEPNNLPATQRIYINNDLAVTQRQGLESVPAQSALNRTTVNNCARRLKQGMRAASHPQTPSVLLAGRSLAADDIFMRAHPFAMPGHKRILRHGPADEVALRH